MPPRRSKANNMFYIKKDTVTWLALVLLTLPHLNPPYLNRFPLWETVFDVAKIVSFVVIVLWVLIFKKKISPVVVLISIWEVFIFITSLLHRGEVYASATSAFSVLSIVLLYDAAYNKGEAFLSSQLFCFEVAVYTNLITILLYPDGLYSDGSYLFTHYKNWFLGYYNNHSIYFIPALLFAWLYAKRTGKRLRAGALTAAAFISAFSIWSGGILTTLFAMLLVYVFFKNRTRIFHYYNYWLLHIAFFLLIYVFRLQELFYWLIGDILKKWSSLTSRIYFWEQTIKMVSKSPLIGYGIQSQFVRAAEIHNNHGIHAHSMLFEILYQGGAIGMCLWIIIIIAAGRRLYKLRNAAECKIIATAFLGWCVATLVEPFTSSFLMGMFIIAYHCGSFISVPERAAAASVRRNRSRIRRKNAVLSGENS